MTHTAQKTLAITLATQNPNKAKELEQALTQALFGGPVTCTISNISSAVPEVAETGSTFLDNALLKAKTLAPWAKTDWVVAEDTGLVVPVLAGHQGLDPFPGLHSNRWFSGSDTQRCAALLELMQPYPDPSQRVARFETHLVLWSKQDGLLFQTVGVWNLDIGFEPRGTNGFGYDPILTLPHQEPIRLEPIRHVAELSASEKAQLSHRGQAIAHLATWLNEV